MVGNYGKNLIFSIFRNEKINQPEIKHLIFKLIQIKEILIISSKFK